MARIAGVNLPNHKRIEYALTYIYGIGDTTAKKILDESGIDPSIRSRDLTLDQESQLRAAIDKFVVEGDLRRKIQLDVKRLQDIGSYRGFRHRRSLPVRGQRTKTNARTKRGKKKSGPSGKKITK